MMAQDGSEMTLLVVRIAAKSAQERPRTGSRFHDCSRAAGRRIAQDGPIESPRKPQDKVKMVP